MKGNYDIPVLLAGAFPSAGTVRTGLPRDRARADEFMLG